MPEFIDAANKKYPQTHFICNDVSQILELGTFDIVIASGLFSIKISDSKEKYFALIKKLFESSNKVIAFNVLNMELHPDDKDFIVYNIMEIYQFCTTLTNKLILRQDYLDYDASFYLYHD